MPPRTKTQRIIFGILMSLSMTYGMELYNAAIRMGFNLTPGKGFSSLTNIVFWEAAKETVFMVIIVFIVSEVIGNKMGFKFMQRHAESGDNRHMQQIFRQAGTIAFMCPAMSFIATIIFQCILGGASIINFPAMWIGTVFKNFPMAFLWNMFFASPFSRRMFDLLFKKRNERVAHAKAA